MHNAMKDKVKLIGFSTVKDGIKLIPMASNIMSYLLIFIVR